MRTRPTSEDTDHIQHAEEGIMASLFDNARARFLHLSRHRVEQLIDALYEGSPPPVSLDVGIARLVEALSVVDKSRLIDDSGQKRPLSLCDIPSDWAENDAEVSFVVDLPPNGLPSDWLSDQPDARCLIDYLLRADC